MNESIMKNIPALSEEECGTLREKRICVIGCGGLGGHIAELATRIGIGSLRVVDGDSFCLSNLNRQLLCTRAVMGVAKAEVARSRILAIAPEANAEAVCEFLNEENADRLVAGCDAVFDALDNVPARRILAEACERAGIPYIYGAIGGWVSQAALSMPGDRLIERLYPADCELPERGVLSFTPAICASMQVALCVRLLVGRPVESSVLYYFDALSSELERIDMRQSDGEV